MDNKIWEVTVTRCYKLAASSAAQAEALVLAEQGSLWESEVLGTMVQESDETQQGEVNS